MNFEVFNKLLFILVLNNKLHILFDSFKLIKIKCISYKREEKLKSSGMKNVEKMRNKHVYLTVGTK